MFNKKFILGLFVLVLLGSVAAADFNIQDSAWSITRHFPIPNSWYSYDITNFNFTITTTNILTNCWYSIGMNPNVNIACADVSSYFGDVSITPLNDGTHNIRLCAEDNSLSMTCDNEIFYVDTVPPTIIDNYNFDGIWTNLDWIVTLTPIDTFSGIKEVKYCENAGCIPDTILEDHYELNYNTDQDTIVRYQAWDNVNNPSAIGQYTVKIDKIPPIVDAGAGVITNTQITQDATVDASISGVATYLWSGPAEIIFGTANAEDTTIEASADGSYIIRLTVVDNAENSNYDEINFMWDTTDPTTTNNAPTGWQASDVTVTLTPTDDLSGVADTLYCVYQDNSCNPTTSGNVIPISDEGVNYLRYYSIDVASNEEDINFVSVSIDKTVPTIIDNYLNNGVWVNTDRLVTLSPQDDISGIKEVKYCESAGCTPNTILENPYELNYNTDQDTTVIYQVWDNADNPSLVGEYNVKLDKTLPTTLDNYLNSGVWVNTEQTITLTPNCEISGCAWTRYCRVFGCDPLTDGLIYTDPVLMDVEGINYFRYASGDNAGNVQTTVERSVMIDRIVPTTTASEVSKTVYTSPAEITLTCADGGSGCDTTLYCYASTNDCVPNVKYSDKITISTNGVWFLKFRSNDTVGNLEDIQDANNNATINIPPSAAPSSSGGSRRTILGGAVINATSVPAIETKSAGEAGSPEEVVNEQNVPEITGAVVGGAGTGVLKDILVGTAIIAAAGLCIFLYRRWWAAKNKLPGTKKLP